MVAATWGGEGEDEFNLRDSVDTVIGQLDEKDYGGIEDVSVLRSLSVVNSGSARRQEILGLRVLDRARRTCSYSVPAQHLAGPGATRR
jgi:hypothetical protein